MYRDVLLLVSEAHRDSSSLGEFWASVGVGKGNPKLVSMLLGQVGSGDTGTYPFSIPFHPLERVEAVHSNSIGQM